jgi:hypothetical protein
MNHLQDKIKASKLLRVTPFVPKICLGVAFWAKAVKAVLLITKPLRQKGKTERF